MAARSLQFMESLRRAFAARFGGAPAFLVRAPGRVNLIGEHTDYNDGLVLPAAIDRCVWMAARPNGGIAVRLFAAAYEEAAEFPVGNPGRPDLPAWTRYPQGVAVQMVARGIRLAGLDAVIAGDLPVGAGLSSSAALEVASAIAFEESAGQPLAPRERALVCHAAEVEFVGVPCGIMDQFAVALCRRGHALFLDCRSQETHHIPLGRDIVLAVCDTGVARTLAGSAYAQRRAECAQAVAALGAAGMRLRALRDVPPDELAAMERLPDPLGRRVRHVVTENARVVEAARLLEGNAPAELRRTFLASHQSLRDDYGVSSPELDAMVEAALEAPGCIAARMTGAGFGGAVVALVRQPDAERFVPAVAGGYRRRTGREGMCFTTEAADGAAVVPAAA